MSSTPRIALVMIVKNESAFIERCLESVKPLISSWTVVDTGSNDATKEIVRKTMKGIPGTLHERPFADFGTNRTEALALARDTADWLLELDADMTVQAHEGLLEWLSGDPDPEVDAWMVEISDSGTLWRLPRLIRGNRDWRYIGPVHEYLDTSQVKTRPLLGLTITHHGSSRHPVQKFDHYLHLLKPGLEAGDPRATFYSAECLRFLNCIPKAVELYQARSMMNGFEEERWYAAYQAAKLSEDLVSLLKVWETRPWRHEPLSAAARIVAARGAQDDLLFLEQT